MAAFNLNESDNWGDYQPPDPPPYITPGTSPQTTTPNYGTNDPPARAADSTPNWLIPTNSDGSQVSGAWAPGASQPADVPGYTWNADYASYMPTTTAPQSQPQAPSTPSAPASDPNQGWQIPTLPSGAQYGGAAWAPGASQPSQTPPGYTWNANFASYQPIPGYTGASATPPTGAYDDNAILAQIKKWASMPGADPSLGSDPNYWLGAIKGKGGLSASNLQYWQDAGVGPTAFFRNPGRESTTTPVSQTPAGGNYTSTNPFSDPATKNYIDLLNSRIQSLLTPQQNPQMDSLMQYMQKYFEQLQGPTYTDAQRATIATQQLDPMERQRQAELRNVATTMASRGITPGSGPYLQAERDINQKYDALRAQTQGGIANNEITLGRQNQSQAVDVGSALASLVNGMHTQQDSRANLALTDARQIPDLAQSRLASAITLLNGNNVNPAQLLTSQQGFQQQGLNQNAQDSQYWSNIIAGLAKAFGL